jgi:hypothetical protein
MRDTSVPAGDKEKVIEGEQKLYDVDREEQRIHALAESTRSLIRDSLADGFRDGVKSGVSHFLAGLAEMVQAKILDDLSARLTERLFPRTLERSGTVKDMYSSIGGFAGGRLDSILASATAATTASAPNLPPGVTTPPAASGPAAIAAQVGAAVAGATGGSQSVGEMTVNAAVVNVSGYGGSTPSAGTGRPTERQVAGQVMGTFLRFRK